MFSIHEYTYQYLVSSMKLFNMLSPWNLFEKITNAELDGQPCM